MKIQTTNRLAHLQVELQETIEQNTLLQRQVQLKQNEVANLQMYVNTNNGDKRITTQYRKTCRELNTLCNQIRRNNRKITRLLEYQWGYRRQLSFVNKLLDFTDIIWYNHLVNQGGDIYEEDLCF